MADLCDLLADALDGFLPTVTRARAPTVEGTIGELAELFGDTPRTQNPRLAAAIAGTTDKRSREYKAAIRSVQRYRAGTRRPSTIRLRVIQARVALQRLGAIITGWIRVSDDMRRRTVQADLSPADTRRVVSAHERGDYASSCAAFEDGFRRGYSDVPLVFEDTESVDLYNAGGGE